MNFLVGVFLAFLLTTFVFVPLGILGAMAFHWLGEKTFDLIADLQEWDMKRGKR